jgi:hypothetical protein
VGSAKASAAPEPRGKLGRGAPVVVGGHDEQVARTDEAALSQGRAGVPSHHERLAGAEPPANLGTDGVDALDHG